MLQLFVNGEGGLTAAGYGLCALLLVLSILAGLFLADRGEKKGFAARQLAYCAMAVALAYVTSFIRVFKMPYGGSVTLLSMLFIVLVANWYGVKTGMLVGFAYGILQFLQEPYFLTLFQVCCDYVLAFAALGLASHNFSLEPLLQMHRSYPQGRLKPLPLILENAGRSAATYGL